MEYLRPGYVGKQQNIVDENGTEYTAVQTKRGPRLGVVVAVGTGRKGEYKIGWSLLSPDEPITIKVEGVKKTFKKPNGEVIEKTVTKRERNIKWDFAINMALQRALDPNQRSPHLRAWAEESFQHFLEKRAVRYFQKNF
jgi:hypothetical protein